MNTGNVGRTCAAVGASLHLIRPYGFVITEKAIRRSGMDYWADLDLHEYDNFDDFIARNQNAAIYVAETKTTYHYAQKRYGTNDFIIFGKESAGIPESILRQYSENVVRIPMLPGRRSLNLASSVAVVLYEALRQNDFIGLS